MTRPTCVHCGRLYGSRVTVEEPFKCDPHKPPPPYRGNGIVVKETRWNEGTSVTYRSIWDGESWSTPYRPFCKLRCALDYARHAYAQRKRSAERRKS